MKKRNNKFSRRRPAPSPGRSPLTWLSPRSENKLQTHMLQGESSLSSNGSGICGISIPFDPSTAGYSFAEWSSFTALYSEIKFVAMEIQIVPVLPNTSGSPLFVGYRYDTNAAPTAIAQVTQLASCRAYNIMRDTSSSSFRMLARKRGPLNWSPTSTVVVNTYAGCPGSFQIWGFGYPNSVNLALVRVRGIYAFRGRV